MRWPKKKHMKKALNITNSQRNENQNYNEVSPHTGEKAIIKQKSAKYCKTIILQSKQNFLSLQTIKAGEGMEKRELSYTISGREYWCNHCG